MKIIGLSAFYHDSAVALLKDQEILFAAQEERYSRIKHDSRFPTLSLNQAFKSTGLKPEEIDAIVFYEKPFLKFERLLETYLAFAPRGFESFVKAMPIWLNEKLFQKKLLQEKLNRFGFKKEVIHNLLFSEHHLSHAASAFFASPFKDALVLTIDGVGEWDTVAAYIGNNNQLTKVRELRFPHSLGLLYSAFTFYCGFKVNSGEYKLMGLAPYGKPKYVDIIKNNLISIKEDGSFKLNLKYFDYCTGLKMTHQSFNKLFFNSQRKPEEPILQIHMDIASSIQVVLEEVILKIIENLQSEFKQNNLCLAGGVALNCTANSRIYFQSLFKQIWIQPAAGDAGGALGAALAGRHIHFNLPRSSSSQDLMKYGYLGSEYESEFIREVLNEEKIIFEEVNSESLLLEKTCELLKNQNVVGWFQGKMEFGPRALGHRSILADARSFEMQKKLNLKIKFRESFRPFAPMVLEQDFSIFFQGPNPSPYMLFLSDVIKDPLSGPHSFKAEKQGFELLSTVNSKIPAVTHVDYTARVQTVPDNGSLVSKLLFEFKKQTGLSVLVNTSFNVRGEPIVATPRDAIQCFMGTDMDALVIGPFIALKKQQQVSKNLDHHKKFDLD